MRQPVEFEITNTIAGFFGRTALAARQPFDARDQSAPDLYRITFQVNVTSNFAGDLIEGESVGITGKLAYSPQSRVKRIKLHGSCQTRSEADDNQNDIGNSADRSC